MNWLYYLAEANLYLCVFYIAYCIFLAKETHYQLNRAYLLLSCIMAFVLPVLQIGALKSPVIAAMPLTETIAPTTSAPGLPYYLWMGYIAGSLVVLVLLTLKLYSVFKLTRKNRAAQGKYTMIYLEDTDVAFSFFNYMFIGTRAAGANTIITHELVHIRQKHSADIMLLEILKVFCWFNPCVHMLQNSLKTIHEYIADEQTAATETDALTYSSFLVNNAYGAGGSSITHSFFNYNLLKKRIIMLNQQRSGKLARLKYLVALPAFAGMLCASTLGFSKNYGWINLGPAAEKANNKALTGNVTSLSINVDTVPEKKLQPPPPEAPKPKTDKVKFPKGYVVDKNGKLNKLMPPPPEPPKPKFDQVKFPPKVNASQKQLPPPPEPPKPKFDQVKFPPKVKFKEKQLPPPPEPPKPKVDRVVFPPKVNTGEKELLPPPPPAPKADQGKVQKPTDVVVKLREVVVAKAPSVSTKPNVDQAKLPVIEIKAVKE